MGTLPSKDTRRLSFDNKFAFNSVIAVPKSIVVDESLLDFGLTSTDTTDELIFADNNRNIDIPDENEVDYWSHRIDNLKKEHQSINKIVEVEYTKQIESTNEIFETPKDTHERIQQIKPCFDWRNKIMQCYEDNPHQPLICSPVVQAFSKCVASCRSSE